MKGFLSPLQNRLCFVPERSSQGFGNVPSGFAEGLGIIPAPGRQEGVFGVWFRAVGTHREEKCGCVPVE